MAVVRPSIKRPQSHRQTKQGRLLLRVSTAFIDPVGHSRYRIRARIILAHRFCPWKWPLSCPAALGARPEGLPYQRSRQRLATAGHRALLSSDKPLLVSACNGLCSTTPALAFRAQPKPTQSLRTAEIRRKYLSAVAPTAS
jgi:hypothetical protein